MTVEYVVSKVQLQKSLASAKERLPAYQTLLEFYGSVFMAQLTSKEKTSPVPHVLSPDAVLVKQQNGFPLITLDEFSVDVPAAAALFQELLSIFQRTPDKWSTFAEAIRTTPDLPPMDFQRLFEKFLSQDDDFFVHLAKQYNIDVQMLSFTTYNSLYPSLTISAEKLTGYLQKEIPWEKGYCPVCGSLPGLAVLKDDGSRAFICSFCFHQWQTKRLYCPFCENSDGSSIQYFYSEMEEGYRVDVCDRCGKYLKGVDLRAITHPLYPPLELVTTMHLDMKAREAGYENAVSNPIE